MINVLHGIVVNTLGAHRKSAAVCLTIALLLLDCALAMADDDWSFRRSRGGGGPMDVDTLLTGLAVVSLAFGLACGAILFFHGWLLSSLAAAKVIAVLGFLSPLAWPVFVLILLPPLLLEALGAAMIADIAGRDPYSGINTAVLLQLAAMLYFYLAYVLLSSLSARAWGQSVTRVMLVAALVAGIGGVILDKGIFPLLLFLACAGCAWLAWKVHQKIAARATAKKMAAAQ
ncbi:hypothetical protein LJC26_04475 [Desulfovibrio sp. OttesenSCG-928-O18]|nr:hypothetical protein [Desulfovibrio sp. OttesenSCG-928-O18]